jgi:MtrB/PioB family decaheme-associated outer membrane protein
LNAFGALAALASLAPSSAQQAVTVDTSDWKCTQCPFNDSGKVDSHVEGGAEHVSGTDAKFGDATGLDKDGLYAVLSGYANQGHEDGTYWSVTALDLGLDARSLTADGGKAGVAEFAVTYDELPHTIFDTTSTPYAGAGSAQLALPAGFVRAPSTGQMSTLGASLNPFDIGYDHRNFGATAGVQTGAKWWTSVEFHHRERDGTLPGSGSFGFSAIEFPQPVKDQTNDVVLALDYRGQRVTGRVAYDASFYDNKNVSMTWDNPYLGTQTGRIALDPNNSAQHLDASLMYRLGRQATLSATAVLGRMTQNDAFLPYSTDPTLSPAPLPRTALDGQVDVTQLGLVFATNLGEYWKILDGLRMRGDVRYDDRNNTTAQASYTYVVTDTYSSVPVTNLPYDVSHLRYGISGNWNLGRVLKFIPSDQRLQISGAWRHDDIKRNFQDASETHEDTGWGRAQYQPLPRLDFAIKLGAAVRDATDVTPTSVLAAPQNPLMRKSYLAYREREFADAEINVRPTDMLSLSVTGRYLDDDYVNSQLGLQSNRTKGTTFSATWIFNDKGATLSAHYGWDQVSAQQAGSSSFATPDWTGNTDDTLNSGSIDLRWPQITPKLSLNFDAFVANTDGDVMTASTIVPTTLLPQLRTRVHGGALSGDYHWNPALTVRAQLRYEHYGSDDWQLDDVDAATVPTLLSLGANAYAHDAKLIMLSFVYRFGPPAGEGESSEK